MLYTVITSSYKDTHGICIESACICDDPASKCQLACNDQLQGPYLHSQRKRCRNISQRYPESSRICCSARRSSKFPRNCSTICKNHVVPIPKICCLEITSPQIYKKKQCHYRTLVLSTRQSLNTTFQTEVPEILPYCGPINSAEVQTQLYSKRFTPKIHSSPHNRQNQTLIAMHQLTLPLNPAEPQSSPH